MSETKDVRHWFTGANKLTIVHQEGADGKWHRALLYCATSIVNVAIICTTINGVWGTT